MSKQDGYVLNDPQYGSVFIGSDKKVKGVERPRQVAVQAASGSCLKLFEDGGFEIQSQASSKRGDNIVSRSQEGLHIQGRNIHLDASNGNLTISAKSITIQSGGSDQTSVIRSEGNLTLEAADTLRLKSSALAVGAKTRMVFHSPGPIYMNSNSGVTIIEPKISLCPKNLLDLVQSMTLNLFGF